jgi:hypothetical protein
MPKQVSNGVKTAVNKFSDDQTKGSFEAILEEIFHDFYRQRRRVYFFNFIRGIFFGAGSALGGTIILAVIIWILSFFVNFPVIGEYLRSLEQTVQHQSKSQ